MSLKLSIVICTYNRSTYLQLLLESFNNQTLSKDLYEIIIVDNNSADNTKEVVEAFIGEFYNTRYIKETKQGLSYARNLGWNEALGEYVLYIDDDCKLFKGWLEAVLEIITGIKPDVFGGPYIACYAYPRPVWVKDEYWSNYHLWGDKPYWEKKQWFTGACFGIKRSLFAIAGGFDPNYGMNEMEIKYGEETEWQERLRNELPQSSFYYSPDLLIGHHVREDKINLFWQLKSRFQSVLDYYNTIKKSKDIQTIRSRARLSSWRNLFGRLWSLSSAIFNFILSFTFNLLFRDRKTYPFFQNYWFEVIIIKAARIAVEIQRLITLITYFYFKIRTSKNDKT